MNEVWHLSTAYNPEGWSVLCKEPRRSYDRRTFAFSEVTCESCRAIIDEQVRTGEYIEWPC